MYAMFLFIVSLLVLSGAFEDSPCAADLPRVNPKTRARLALREVTLSGRPVDLTREV